MHREGFRSCYNEGDIFGLLLLDHVRREPHVRLGFRAAEILAAPGLGLATRVSSD